MNKHHSKTMKRYEEKRKRLEEEILSRKREIHEKVPKFREVEASFARGGSLFINKALQGITSEFMEDFQAKQTLLKNIQSKTLTDAGYPENYLEVKHDCFKCNDTGYILTEKCECYWRELKEVLYEECNIGKSIKDVEVSAFELELYSTECEENDTDSPYEKAVKIEKYITEAIQNISEQNVNIYIKQGSYEDRDQLAKFITKSAIEEGQATIYIPADHMFKVLREWRFNRNEFTPELKELLNNLTEVTCLVIESLGDERQDSFVVSDLFEVINTRMLKGLNTIITTRCSLKECSELYSDRIVSRIIGNYEIIDLPQKPNALELKLMRLS